MRAMVIERTGEMVAGAAPLRAVELPRPEPGAHELLIQGPPMAVMPNA
jgi:hypothetical protein